MGLGALAVVGLESTLAHLFLRLGQSVPEDQAFGADLPLKASGAVLLPAPSGQGEVHTTQTGPQTQDAQA